MAPSGRTVTVDPLAGGGYRVRIEREGQPPEEIVTHLPLPLVQVLAAYRGRDAFGRFEDPQAYAGLEQMLARRGVSLAGLDVLDVGGRYGSSAFAAGRLGARRVVAIDIGHEPLSLGKRIVAAARPFRELHGGAEVTFAQIAPGAPLPFAPASFDAILCNALLEHVLPAQRPATVAEMWRLLRPGGLLIVQETPNRWWPRDGHTTKLWLVPYLPRPLAQLAIRLFSRRFTREQVADWQGMLVAGVRGVSYAEVARHAPGHDSSLDRRADDIAGHYDLMLQTYHSRRNRLANGLQRTCCRVAEWLICKPFGLPNTVVTPHLYMALRKK